MRRCVLALAGLVAVNGFVAPGVRRSTGLASPLQKAKQARLPQLQAVALPAESATTERPPLGPDDEWIGKLDLEGFRSEIRCVLLSNFLRRKV